MRKKDEPTRMPDGRFRRDIGWKADGKGGFMQHRFYIGRDRGEALLRALQLERVWDCVERRARPGERALWDDLSLMIGQAVARGEAVVRLVPPNPEALGVAGPNPMLAVQWLRAVQLDFPAVRLELADAALQERGEAIRDADCGKRAEFAEAVAREAAREAQAPPTGATGQTLHQALDAYAHSLRRTYLLPGRADTLSQHGVVSLKEVGLLREHHEDRPLDLLGVDAIEAMIGHWRHRPMSKRGRPIAPRTAVNMVKRVRHFVRWLHKSPAFKWRKPADLETMPVRIPMTPEEVSARMTPTRVQTYSLDELCLLYEYATPWERSLLLLGLNCGFGIAEMGTVQVGEVHLRGPHGRYPREGSFIKRVRYKSRVYGEWSLWPQTVAGVEWQLARRGKTEHTALILTQEGQPLTTPTRGNNANQRIPNAWARLTKRVRKDHPEFRALSFNKLRKTGADMVKRFSDGETAGVFLCHGQPVRADVLADVYTNRHFDKTFAALDAVGAYLAPMFARVPDPFPAEADAPATHPVISLGKIRRIRALRAQGFTLRKIAELVGVSDETVRRHTKNPATGAGG